MKASRRAVIAGAVQCGAGVGLTAAGVGQAQAAPADGPPEISYKLHPIGTVEKGDMKDLRMPAWLKVKKQAD
jgi:hypothetical protein